MKDRHDVGFDEALAEVLASTAPLPARDVPVEAAAGLVATRELTSRLDCPAAPVAAMDGYAVAAAELSRAGAAEPVRLPVAGTVVAGGGLGPPVPRGKAVRIATGALLPPGTDAVLEVEASRLVGTAVEALRAVEPGENVLRRAADLAAGDLLVRAGERIRPGLAGLLAAGGRGSVSVHPAPRVGVLATGDELVPPGRLPAPGQVVSGAQVAVLGWLQRFGLGGRAELVRDDRAAIRRAAAAMALECDALVTGGGTGQGERDRTLTALREEGLELCFSGVRVAPGRPTAFGLLGYLPVFCLPGGPSACELAFLVLALPALLQLAGRPRQPFRRTRARLARPVAARQGQTRFVQAGLETGDDGLVATPRSRRGRLLAMARAEALVRVEEGGPDLEAGGEVELLDLRWEHGS